MNVTNHAILLICFASTAWAQTTDEKLWPHGLPPGAKPIEAARIAELEAKDNADRIFYVGDPTITIHKAEKPNGCGVVIFPGGGYNILAYPKEGTLLFIELKKAGVPGELHVFGTGGHGYGIRGNKAATKWNLALADWLGDLGMLTEPTGP